MRADRPLSSPGKRYSLHIVDDGKILKREASAEKDDSVRVPVVRVRVVLVRVCHRIVAMAVAVARTRRHRFVVLMLMMLVVHMFVRVFQRLVVMHVCMPLRQMQPNAQRHQCRSDQQAA